MSLATSLYDALTAINIPKHQAREVVEALEHKMTTEFATKPDIALIRADIAVVVGRLERHEEMTKTEFAAVRNEMRTEFAAVRNEMAAEFAAVRNEMKAEFSAVRNEMAAEFAAVRNEMKAEFAAVRGESQSLEYRLVVKLGGLMVTLFGVFTAVIAFLR
jgi:hypothetical protein